MCVSKDSKATRSCWRSDLLGFAVLLAVAEFARLAGHHGLWFRNQYELLSLIVFVAASGAACFGVMMLYRMTQSTNSVKHWPRVVPTLFFVAIGFRVGGRYVHMCQAGSPFVEGLAMLGTPVLAGTVVFLFKGRACGCLVATCLLVVVWILAGPYLAWVHGN